MPPSACSGDTGPTVTRQRGAHRRVSGGVVSLFPLMRHNGEGPNSVILSQGQRTTSWGTCGEETACRLVGETGLASDVLPGPPRPSAARKMTVRFHSTTTRTLSPLVISWEQNCGLGSPLTQGTRAPWGFAKGRATAQWCSVSRGRRQPRTWAVGLRLPTGVYSREGPF